MAYIVCEYSLMKVFSGLNCERDSKDCRVSVSSLQRVWNLNRKISDHFH